MPDQSLLDGIVPGTTLVPGRRVWTLQPQSSIPVWAAIFLDAELYIEKVNAPAVLQRLQQSQRIPPLLAIFISHNCAAARHTDFTRNPDYADFLAHDVVPWLLDAQSGIDPRRLVIAGLSLSGLAAAHAAVTHPDVFAAAICQSPSFWWNDESFRRSLPSKGPFPACWFSVGDRETESGVTHPPSGLLQRTSQRAACKRTSDALRSRGCNVSFRVFEGGHDPACWREDLTPAFSWAAGLPMALQTS